MIQIEGHKLNGHVDLVQHVPMQPYQQGDIGDCDEHTHDEFDYSPVSMKFQLFLCHEINLAIPQQHPRTTSGCSVRCMTIR